MHKLTLLAVLLLILVTVSAPNYGQSNQEGSACFPIIDRDILFHDTFEEEPDPRWRSLTAPNGFGWIADDGWYRLHGDVPVDLPISTFVGSSEWSNYNFEFEVNYRSTRTSPWDRPHRMVLYFRAQDRDNLMGFFFNIGRESWFDIKVDGVWQNLHEDQESAVGRLPELHTVRVMLQARGDSFRLIADDEIIATFEDDRWSLGYVGLRAAHTGPHHGRLGWLRIGNVRVRSLDSATTGSDMKASEGTGTSESPVESKTDSATNDAPSETISDRWTEVEASLQAINDRFDTEIDTLNDRVDKLNEHLEAMPTEATSQSEAKMETVLNQIQEHETAIESLKSSLTSLDERLADRNEDAAVTPDDVNGLDQAIDAVSNAHDTLDERLTALESSTRDHEADHPDATKMDRRFDRLQDQVSTMTDRVEGLERASNEGSTDADLRSRVRLATLLGVGGLVLGAVNLLAVSL